MKFLETIAILATMYPIAIVGAQFFTRFFKIKRITQPKKIWKFELPTKIELIFALLAVMGLGVYMFLAGYFE